MGHDNELPLELLSTKEVAAICGLNRNTLYSMRAEGRGPRSIRLPGTNKLRWRKRDVLAWVNAGEERGGPSSPNGGCVAEPTEPHDTGERVEAAGAA